ncbi:S1C family serine protease [Candidatus Binatia bacterium]|nr:S1C family serine protease [Candidatus Binatia bacterium]
MNASIKLLQHVVPATVALHTTIAESHPSAGILGTERLGSGVIVDPAGLILTVNYVVLGSSSVTVSLADDTEVPGRVVAQDFASGVAIVQADRTLPGALPLGTFADLKIGQDVFIVAAASENKRRLHDGGITSLGPFDAYWEYSLDRAITTTATNPGVGGAPLLDLLGRVIGIVSLDLGEVGRFTLAIPVDYYSDHKNELLQFGRRTTRAQRAWIGLYCYTFRDHVVVAGVLPDTPGDRAGLKAGDIVLAVDGQEVANRGELYRRLWEHRPGDVVNVRVYRTNQVKELPITCGDAEEFFA